MLHVYGHIILIPSQPVFALSPQCCMFSGPSQPVFALSPQCCMFSGPSQPVFALSPQCCLVVKQHISILYSLFQFEPTIYCTRGKHTNNTDAVWIFNDAWLDCSTKIEGVTQIMLECQSHKLDQTVCTLSKYTSHHACSRLLWMPPRILVIPCTILAHY